MLVACAALLALPMAHAEVPPLVTTGQTGVATAVPNIPVPAGTPCVVPLFTDQQFIGFNPVAFNYAPPASCPGPWAKVVLQADYSVNAGRQFDRTASIWVGGVNLYFGTTQEPSAAIAPTWHVERDVTDYSALLRVPAAAAPSSATSSTAPTPASSPAARAWCSTRDRRMTCRIR